MVMTSLWVHLGAQFECLVGIGVGIARCFGDSVTVLSNKMNRDEQHEREDQLSKGQLCRLEAIVQHCTTNRCNARLGFERACNLPYMRTLLRQGAVHVARKRLLNELCSQLPSGIASAALVQELTLAMLDSEASQQYHVDLATASSCIFAEMAVAELTKQPTAVIEQRFSRAEVLFEARVSVHLMAQLDQLPPGCKQSNVDKAIQTMTQIHAQKVHAFAMGGYIAKKVGIRWRYHRGASSLSIKELHGPIVLPTRRGTARQNPVQRTTPELQHCRVALPGNGPALHPPGTSALMPSPSHRQRQCISM